MILAAAGASVGTRQPLQSSSLHWLAGLLEGEGWFGMSKRGNPGITVAMTDRDVMLRAGELLAPHLSLWAEKKEKAHYKQCWRLTVSGVRAAAWMMTLWPLMGERRRTRILEALAEWRAHPVINARKWNCKNGHALVASNLKHVANATRRTCLACDRNRSREYMRSKRARARIAQALLAA